MKDREEKETALFDLPRMQITRLIQTDNSDLYRLEFQEANPNKYEDEPTFVAIAAASLWGRFSLVFGRLLKELHDIPAEKHWSTMSLILGGRVLARKRRS
ncbi:hypothetical protein TNCV_3450981 [Trichonephila clavipes]|uniref:Uncharacterized protein n=1 Tax=Trichonephila clavipes TaxID=2585209 RepID=A0A8X6WK46_TRICX|nr:hypothetical protein TNCV_3450981 [Trichonephila clavipes]